MSEHNTHSGDVMINLTDNGEVALKPTLDAAIRLSSAPGGINKMVDRCVNYEFDAILTVVQVGIGENSKDLPGIVFRTGMIELAPSCIEFLHVIANGGRSLSDKPEQKEDGTPLANSSQ